MLDIFKKKKRRFKFLLLLPIAALLSCITVFFIADEFWLKMHLLVLNPEDNNIEGVYVAPSGSVTYPTGSESSTGGTVGSSSALTGVVKTGTGELALINKMGGGYCKDWLDIARGSCMGTYLHPNSQLPNDRLPSPALLIGTAIKEDGVTYLNKKQVPRSNIDITNGLYGTEIDGDLYSLYEVNSTWLNKHGYSYIDKTMNAAMRTPSNPTYRTTFQMTGMLTIAPNGDNDSGGSYPSRLNGYGIASGTLRDKSQGDYAFFPDECAAALHSMVERVDSYFKNYYEDSPIDIDLDMRGAMYAAMHLGEGIAIAKLGCGQNFTSTTWNDSMKLGAISAYRDITDGIVRVSSYISAHPESMSENDYSNTQMFLGMSIAYLVKECGGFTTPDRVSSFKSKCGDSIKAGMKLMLLALEGKSYSDSEINAFVNSIPVKSVSGLRLGTSSHSGLPEIYWLDQHGVNDSRESYSGPAVHTGDPQMLLSAYQVTITGKYMYWKMLTYAGVEVTYEEACSDLGGTYIERIVTYSTEETETRMKLEGSTYGETIARIAVDYALKYRSQAIHNNGTARYKASVDAVHETQRDYRACNVNVNTAIRRAGIDDTCPFTSSNKWDDRVRYQWDYFVNSPLWEQVDFDGYHYDNLKPGDVLIYSGVKFFPGDKDREDEGHILFFVGYDLVHEKYPDLNETNCLEEASYSYTKKTDSDRGAHISEWSKGSARFKDYRVMRCVGIKGESKYAGLNFDAYDNKNPS